MKFTLEGSQLELDLSLSKASVLIYESDQSDVELVFAGLRKKSVEEVFDVGLRNNRLFVKEKASRNTPPVLDTFLSSGFNSDLKLMIPKGTDLSGRIATLKGGIRSENLTFSGLIKSIAGSVEIDSLQTDGINIQNVSGGITLKEFEGFLKGNTMTGRITIEKGTFKDVSLKSVSGDILLGGIFALENDSDISTMSGSIYLDVKEYRGDNYVFLSTLSGSTDIKGDYPEESIQVKRRMPMFKDHPFKSVVPTMKEFFSSFVSTSNKNDVEVETGSQKSEDDSVKKILEMLSEGKITAEEAEKLIRALGKTSGK